MAITTTVIEGVIGLGAIWSGLVAIRAIAHAFGPDNSAIELVQVEPVFYRNDRSDPRIITGVHLSALLVNSGTAETCVSVQSIASSLGGQRGDPESVAWRTLPVGPGVTVDLSADNITRKIRQGEYVQGRIDWTVAIARQKSKRKKEFRIKGEIGIDNTRAKGPRFLWQPDQDSEHPIGKMAAVQVKSGLSRQLRKVSKALDKTS